MVEKWFAIFIIVINILDVGIAFDKHGEPRNDKYNAWISLIDTCIFLTLAWLGGVFRCFE